ncbi:DUF924 domain-containing protein [Litoreibacter sp.]|nr:DUF924 domain-containing protein [Litoreibacter sp.]
MERIIARMPAQLAPMGDAFRGQHARVAGNIAKFGRHPHRNHVLGRLSTPEEEAYITKGDFPHSNPERSAA